MKTKILPILFSILFFFSISFSQDSKIKSLNNEIEQISNVKNKLKTLHFELLDLKIQIDSLNRKAKIHQNNNQLKVVIKSLKDLYSLVTDSPSSMFDVVKTSIENIVIEPYYQKARKVKVDLKKFSAERNVYTNEIIQMYDVLSFMLKSELRYFDDDMPSSKYTKKYWRKGDGQADDEAELVTRKMHVIIGLSNDLSEKIYSHCQRIRKDYLMFDNLIDENKKIIKYLNKELAVNNQIRESQKKRQLIFANQNKIDEQKINSNKAAVNKSEKKIDFKNTPERAKNHANIFSDERENPMESFAAEKKNYIEFLKNGYKIGESAKVEFVINERSKLVSGWAVLAEADINPNNALGDLIWKIDDIVVGYTEVKTTNPDNRKFTYIFDTPGIYDVSVELNVNGKFIDKYLTQLTIEPNNLQMNKEKSIEITVFNNSGKTNLKPKKNDKKVQIVNLPYAKYWVSGIEGQEIISGFYYNMMSQKKEYESLKIMDYNFTNPTYGFFALKSLNGYHVYRTVENDKPQLVIVLLGQKGIEYLNKIKNVKNFKVEISPDYSSAKVYYDTPLNKNEVINLK